MRRIKTLSVLAALLAARAGFAQTPLPPPSRLGVPAPRTPGSHAIAPNKLTSTQAIARMKATFSVVGSQTETLQKQDYHFVTVDEMMRPAATSNVAREVMGNRKPFALRPLLHYAPPAKE